jgi:hypothetical protein
MTLWQVVLAASIVVLALKLAGYLVPRGLLERETPARVASLLTVALLAALVAVQTLAAGQSIAVDARLPALVVAGGLFAARVPFILVVLARHPAVAGLAPTGLLDRLGEGLRLRVVESVGVEHAVEVVVLVLEDASEPAFGGDLER